MKLRWKQAKGVLKVLALLVLAGCPTIISSDKAITSFAFLAANNPGLSMDYTGMIVGTDITVRLPFYVDRSNLVTTYATMGALVQVGGVTQVSGVTANDFAAPVGYIVTASDGTRETYSVKAVRGLQKVVAPDAEGADRFGCSVSVSGDYAIVGAMSFALAGSDTGAAYVFQRTGNISWNSVVKLEAPDAQALDWFGAAVSISGDYAIVGAPGEAEGSMTGTGAAYVFHRTDTNSWDSGVRLLSSDAEAGDRFGWSVSISGDYAIVGARGENQGGSDAGGAYVFHRTGTNSWDSGVKLVAFDARAGDEFGHSVAICESYAVVGSPNALVGSSDAGAAYVFYRTGTTSWDSGKRLVAQDAQQYDHFGWSVSIGGYGGGHVLVGAVDDDEGGIDSGAAYMFRSTAGPNYWDSGVKVLASDAFEGDGFGVSVSIGWYYAIVGANGSDTEGNLAGAAYVFRLAGLNPWDGGEKLVALDAQTGDLFGQSVSISDSDGSSEDCAIVGASEEDTGGPNAGAAYVY